MARRQHSFRLQPQYIATLDRWAKALSERLNRPVNRTEALRFILEGSLRAEQKLPEVGDAALFELAQKRGT